MRLITNLIFACLLTTSVWCRYLESSRSVFRSSDSGSVNIVEFNARGITYGRCSYTNAKGEIIAVQFEELKSEIRARSDMKEVTDPVEETKLCRAAAAAPPTSLDSRSDDDQEETRESEFDLGARMSDFMSSMYEGQQYVNSLSPRLIRIVPLNTTASTGTGFLSNFFNKFSQFSFGTVNVPLPVLNVPVGIQEINIPLIVPTLQNVAIPKPIIGKK